MIETIQAFRAEERDDILAIGRGSAVGMCGFQVPLPQRLPGGRFLSPHKLTRRQIVCVQLPRPHAGIVRRLARPSQPTGTERWFRFGGIHGRRDEHAIAPHNRGRMRESLDRCLPQNVLTGRNVPLSWWSARSDSCGARAAKLRPVIVGAQGSGTKQQETQQEQGQPTELRIVHGSRISRLP